MVDPNRIGSDLFHEGGIECTLRGIHERVVFDQLVSNTWADEESVTLFDLC